MSLLNLKADPGEGRGEFTAYEPEGVEDARQWLRAYAMRQDCRHRLSDIDTFDVGDMITIRFTNFWLERF